MKYKVPLALQIFIALILGIATGIMLMPYGYVAQAYIRPIGTIFLNLIKFIIVPLVLTSIICGIISLGDIKKIGKTGLKAIVFYTLTTAFAITAGIVVANVFKGFLRVPKISANTFDIAEPKEFSEIVIDIFPDNFISPMLSASMMQVIIMAIIISMGIIMSENSIGNIHSFFKTANDICMNIMELILKISPLGVFCLITPVIAENGAKILSGLASLLIITYIAYLLHMLTVYSFCVRFFAKLSPIVFFKKMLPAIVFAFSSSSSISALQLNLSCTEKLGAKKEISEFILPLGATINMDGTAIYQGICVFFIASCYGLSLSFEQLVSVIIIATLASIGTAGVPSSGMVMLAMVLQSVGLPLEGIALVAGIDRLFDMGRTAVNITGDAVCTLMMSKEHSI